MADNGQGFGGGMLGETSFVSSRGGHRRAECEGCPVGDPGWVCSDHKMIVAISGQRWAGFVTLALLILAGVGGTYWRVSGIAADVAVTVKGLAALEKSHEALERRVNDHHDRERSK